MVSGSRRSSPPMSGCSRMCRSTATKPSTSRSWVVGSAATASSTSSTNLRYSRSRHADTRLSLLPIRRYTVTRETPARLATSSTVERRSPKVMNCSRAASRICSPSTSTGADAPRAWAGAAPPVPRAAMVPPRSTGPSLDIGRTSPRDEEPEQSDTRRTPVPGRGVRASAAHRLAVAHVLVAAPESDALVEVVRAVRIGGAGVQAGAGGAVLAQGAQAREQDGPPDAQPPGRGPDAQLLDLADRTVRGPQRA